MRCNTLIFSQAHLDLRCRNVSYLDSLGSPIYSRWSNVLVLLAGVILAPGRRTVTTALRILGRECDPDFCTFHRTLNRAAWSSRAVARQLLILLIKPLCRRAPQW
jgi:hypothetical protein